MQLIQKKIADQKNQTKKKHIVILIILLSLFVVAVSFNREKLKFFVISKHAIFTTSPEIISLDISFKNLQKIAQNRQEAIIQNVRLPSDNIWVPAKISNMGKKTDAKIRLKGTLSDHWNTGKWSLKVRTKQGKTLFGMKDFSLHEPNTRSLLVEPLFNQLLLNNDLIYRRMRFVELHINGKNMGLYLLSENASKLLIENNNRRDGPLLQFDKTIWIENRQQKIDLKNESYQATYVKPANPREYANQEELRNLYNHAIGKLEEFKNHNIMANEIFDIESISRVAALFALFGSYELDWKDMVFYFNPLTSKIEIIGKEVHSIDNMFANLWWIGKELYPDRKDFVDSLFSDPEFRSRYYYYLEKFTNDRYLNHSYEKLDQFISSQIAILKREYPIYRSPWQLIKRNAKQIQSYLRANNRIVSYLEQTTDNQIKLRIYSRHRLDVLPIAVIDSSNNVIAKIDSDSVIKGYMGDKIDFHTYELMLNKPIIEEELALKYSILGINVTGKDKINNWMPIIEDKSATSPPVGDLSAYFDVDKNKKTISCRVGVTQITRPVTIPKDFIFQCKKHAKFIFAKGVYLKSYGSINLMGKPDAQIVIEGEKGANGFWLMNSPNKSKIEHTVFRSLGASDSNSMRISGAVSIYESNVEISNSVFESNQSGDDNLNIIRSFVQINDVKIENSLYDAMDLDFVEGQLKNIIITNSGNDGIDISGSDITLENIDISNSKDKSISVGEQSIVSAIDLHLSGANMALVSKDSSVVQVDNVLIEQADYAFSAYQKKEEFGGGTLKIRNAKWSDDVKQVTYHDSVSNIDWIN